jgi:hypothetical protein
MKKENIIEDTLNEKDIKEINEEILAGREKGVYILFFKCKNENAIGFPTRGYCLECPWIYKNDIRLPNSFGCHARDYIEKVKKQSKVL